MYLVTTQVSDGSVDYKQIDCVLGKNKEDAVKKALVFNLSCDDHDKLSWVDEKRVSVYDMTVTLCKIVELSAEESSVMAKYLTVIQ